MQKLLDRARFRRALSATDKPLPLFRATLDEGSEMIRQRFDSDEPISNLVALRARMVDFLLEHAWRMLIPKGAKVALVAVGGYGRGELHPGSDVDLLILLHPQAEESGVLDSIECFVRFLWDLKLDIGHSVRSVEQCKEEAAHDLTIITNLMESRFLTGYKRLFNSMRRAIEPDRMWSSAEFFAAKAEEQRKRHSRGDLASNLEPNIKECRGGLRDIQTIGWVLKRHYRAESLHDLVAHGFINEAEYRALADGQELLWRIRFALHVLSKRHEDRLLFDHQRTLAAWFGYADKDHSLAVEQFMQLFYRTITRLQTLNERLLQLFDEAILQANKTAVVTPLNRRFRAHNGYIEVIDPEVFHRTPFALLEIFLLLQQHPELKGIRAATIRAIRFSRHEVDQPFREDLRDRSLFMEILRQPLHVARELRRMNRYGILGRYIPAFGNIVGRMQFDLFHMYTVDEHTLNLVRNLHHFALPEKEEEHPFCHHIMGRIPKRELLYLGGLFHDIAKGRGGDHSTLGMADAREFCQLHDLPKWDTDLVVWLVQNHLIMSMVAQRQDINDPDVILEFARRMGDITHLDYLYLLTVADVRATDPNKWNSWKDSLLKELYNNTKRALLRGLDNPEEVGQLAAEQRRKTLEILGREGVDEAAIRPYWDSMQQDYFLQFSIEGLAWHAHRFLETEQVELPLVRVRRRTGRGGSEVMIISRDRDLLFADSTCLLDQLRLNIVSARLETMANGLILDSFTVLEEDGEPIDDDFREKEIIDRLTDALAVNERPQLCLSGIPTRRQRHFDIPSRIDYCRDPAGQRTIMKLVTRDRPGLLAIIGGIFHHCGVRLHGAKIATIGAEAEDTFFITDRAGNTLSEKAQYNCLHQQILSQIDN
jgi:[protein-PII] uridylyltransferase